MTVVIGKEQKWHGPRGSHLELRRRTVRKILTMLREKHPSDTDEECHRIVRIAKSLEYRLYRNAKTMRVYFAMEKHMPRTIDHYLQEETIKEQLHEIVTSVYDVEWETLPAGAAEEDRPLPEPDPTIIPNAEG